MKNNKRVLSVVILVLLAACGTYYYFWKQARIEAWQQGEKAEFYKSLREAFLGNVKAGELAQAYGLTSQRFQQEVDRFQFAMLAQRFNQLDQQKQTDYLGESVSQSGPSSGDPGGLAHQRMEFHRQFRYQDGKLITIALKLHREADSLFLLSPPPLKVDAFVIEEKAGEISH